MQNNNEKSKKSAAISNGIYRHYKGGTYRVIGQAKHSETLEDMVIYEALYDNDLSRFWARSLDEFVGDVEWGGKRV
jgi:hypothetical protein